MEKLKIILLIMFIAFAVASICNNPHQAVTNGTLDIIIQSK